MLEGLDTIVWENWQDAYGPATALPDLLRTVATAESKEAARALADLTDRIAHQGLATPAAIPTAPFLVELVQGDAGPRDELLVLLADLSCGGSHVNVPIGADPRDELPEALAPVRTAALQAWPAFVAALDARAAGTRAAGALALAVFPEHAEAAREALRRRIAKDKAAAPLATCALALAMLAAPAAAAADLEAVAPLLDHRKAEVALAAAIAIACLRPDDADAHADLVARVGPQRGATVRIPFNEGRLAAFGLAVALHHLARLRATDALERAMQHVPWMALVPALLGAVLGPSGRRPVPWAREELPASARPVLRMLAERVAAEDDAKRMFNPSTFVSWGLLSLPRLLGVRPERTLDREIDGEPLWRVALQVNAGQRPAHDWTERVASLSEPEREDLADDLLSPPVPYHLSGSYARRHARGFDVALAGRQAFADRILEVLATLPTEALRARVPRALDDAKAGLVLLDAWTGRLQSAGEVLAPELDAAVGRCLEGTHIPAAMARRLFARVPPDRREAIVLAMPMNFLLTDIDDGSLAVFLRSGLAVADLAPTAAVRDRVLGFFATDAYLTFDAPASANPTIVAALVAALRPFGPDTATACRAAAQTAGESRERWARLLRAAADELPD